MADYKDIQDKILSEISAKRWSQVAHDWETICQGEPLPFAFHQPIIDRLSRKQDPEHLVRMYERAVDALLEKGAHDTALEVSEYLLGIDEKHEWLRGRALKAIEKVYADAAGSRLEEYILEAGLFNDTLPLKKGLVKFHDLLGATKGQVFIHSSWGLGVVRELDLEAGKVIIDFELKKSQQMTLDGVRNFLQRLPKDHLQSHIATRPMELRDQMKGQAGEVVRLALKSFGGKVKVADLKRITTTRFLSESEYKSFWEKAKKAIKLDPWVDSRGSGANTELHLRKQPRSYFDEIFQELNIARSVEARRDVLRDVRKHGAEAEMTEKDVDALYELFVKPANDGSLVTATQRLNHGLLFDQYQDLFPSKSNPINVKQTLQGGDMVELLAGVEGHDSRREALGLVKELRPNDWPEVFAETFISADPRTATWVEKELKNTDNEHYRQVALESVLAKPDANPDLFVWASRNILEGTWDHLGDSIRPIMICEELLSLLSELEDLAASEHEAVAAIARNAGTKIRSLLNEGNGKFFKKAVQKSTVEEARKILRTIRLHNSLSHQLKSVLEMILINEHQDLRKGSRLEEEEERRRPSYHYTTRQSLDEKRSELSRLVSEEIPGMAKVIETAREMGDLRENAEYHAAKDRQKLLMQQAAELEDLIARARLVESREVIPDSSRFGTKVRLRDAGTGSEREMTILGMWEADLSRNVISYLTPFGSQLLGRHIGDLFDVTLQDGTKQSFELLDISLGIPAYNPGEGS
ncbi:GreA/GreB family elongation factor [Candidatus Sumerlaeota bacterium]|nr:GreA/GreB family elongation factor [Candidatus Sumerlaeota bacterium]